MILDRTHEEFALALSLLAFFGASACSTPKLDNCDDPAGFCRSSALPEGSILINDFEAKPYARTSTPTQVAIGCSELFAGEDCNLPLKNKLGLCADSLFCAFGGSVCGSTVQGTEALDGGQSWRLRFNESLIPGRLDPSAADGGSEAGVANPNTEYPFSGYTERLTSLLGPGPGCEESRISFSAMPYAQMTMWVKPGDAAGNDKVDFEIALKADHPTVSDPSYPETSPKVSFTDCQTWTPSCVCGHAGKWQKLCIPLTRLETGLNGTRVNLAKLIEVNIAFAANPYVIDRHERGAAEITIDNLAFEP